MRLTDRLDKLENTLRQRIGTGAEGIRADLMLAIDALCHEAFLAGVEAAAEVAAQDATIESNLAEKIRSLKQRRGEP